MKCRVTVVGWQWMYSTGEEDGQSLDLPWVLTAQVATSIGVRLEPMVYSPSTAHWYRNKGLLVQ